MANYIVTFRIVGKAKIEVEAESKEEALEKALNTDMNDECIDYWERCCDSKPNVRKESD